jgi:hypothetical protein
VPGNAGEFNHVANLPQNASFQINAEPAKGLHCCTANIKALAKGSDGYLALLLVPISALFYVFVPSGYNLIVELKMSRFMKN